MKRRTLVLGLLACVARPSAAADDVADAGRAATAWLALVDAGDYAGSWQRAGELFRKAVPSTQWVTAVAGTLEPMGPLKKRASKSGESLRSLPGVPDGRYVVLKFDAAYANKAAAVETVAVALEADGQWRVVGYFIN